MSRRLVGFNLGLGVLALVFAIAMGRELMHSRPLPSPAQIRPAASAAHAPVQEEAAREPAPDSATMGETRAASDASAGEIIASGNLFDPARRSTDAVAEPTGPRPLLYGVVAGAGAKSRAYVEDPVSKVVRGYQVGDSVAGWRLDQIHEDRVVIAGAERGTLEVLLREPSKPRPALVASAVAAVTAGAQPAAGLGPAGGQQAEPGSPSARPAPGPDVVRDATPRGIGAIPAQLFRPVRTPSSASRAMPAGHE